MYANKKRLSHLTDVMIESIHDDLRAMDDVADYLVDMGFAIDYPEAHAAIDWSLATGRLLAFIDVLFVPTV